MTSQFENGKYTVFKTETIEKHKHVLGDLMDEVVEDAVVIRLKDQLAAAALHAYASAAANAVDIIQGVTDTVNLDGLKKIRDKFFEFALAADSYGNKRLPD